MQNPPLARAIYASVEVDQEIPPEHYKAMAEVIGFVMRLKGEAAKRKFTSGNVGPSGGKNRERSPIEIRVPRPQTSRESRNKAKTGS